MEGGGGRLAWLLVARRARCAGPPMLPTATPRGERGEWRAGGQAEAGLGMGGGGCGGEGPFLKKKIGPKFPKNFNIWGLIQLPLKI